MVTQHGAFLDDIWTFDHSFFNITPREAKSMDPQQRLLLHTVQSALDDAGYVPDATPTFQKATIGCYIGVATGDYTDNLRDDIDVFYSPGNYPASSLKSCFGRLISVKGHCELSTVGEFLLSTILVGPHLSLTLRVRRALFRSFRPVEPFKMETAQLLWQVG